MPEFALAIDIYEGWVHVQEYAAPKSIDERSAKERLSEALAVIPEALGIERDRMICKQRQRQTGTNQYEKQDISGEFFHVQEHGCTLKVNLKDYLDTGLFLDHRPVRHWIQQNASWQAFLELVLLYRRSHGTRRRRRCQPLAEPGFVENLCRLG